MKPPCRPRITTRVLTRRLGVPAPVPLEPSARRAHRTLDARTMPGEEADDAEVSPSPLAKKLRCDRSKTVRFSPAAKALGGGLSQRQGQPLATLQLTSLIGAFGHESPRHALCPVAESRESTPLQGPSVRPSTDDHATQMREGSTDEFAATANGAEITSRTDNPGTPELSTAMRLLPRTPHFDAIARAAAGSSLEGVAEQSLPARSAPQAADAAPLESPLRRIREATASLMQQLRTVDATTSQIRSYPTLPYPTRPPPVTPARSHVALPSGSRTALQPMPPLQEEELPQPPRVTKHNATRQGQPPSEPPSEAPANLPVSPAEPPPLQASAEPSMLQAWLPSHITLVLQAPAPPPPAPTPPAPPPSAALALAALAESSGGPRGPVGWRAPPSPPAPPPPPPSSVPVPPAPVLPAPAESTGPASGGRGPASGLAATEPAAAEPTAAVPAAAVSAASLAAVAIAAVIMAAAAVTAAPTSELEGAAASSNPSGPAAPSDPGGPSGSGGPAAPSDPGGLSTASAPALLRWPLTPKPQLLGARVRVLSYVENNPAQASARWLPGGFLSAPDRASGCSKLRSASANQPLGHCLGSACVTPALRLSAILSTKVLWGDEWYQGVGGASTLANPNPNPDPDPDPKP